MFGIWRYIAVANITMLALVLRTWPFLLQLQDDRAMQLRRL
jgi:hypothetical protein